MHSEKSKGKESWKELKYDELKSTVKRGDESSKTKLAWLKLSGLGGADVDEEGAVALLEERVEDGDDGDAMWMLGVCYEYGRGIGQDIERAEMLYKQSSEKGNKIGAFFDQYNQKNEKEYRRGCGRVKLSGLWMFHSRSWCQHLFVVIIGDSIFFLERIIPIAPWTMLSFEDLQFQY